MLMSFVELRNKLNQDNRRIQSIDSNFEVRGYLTLIDPKEPGEKDFYL